MKQNMLFYLFVIFILSFVSIKSDDNNIIITNLNNLNSEFDEFAPSYDKTNNYLYYVYSKKQTNFTKKIKIDDTFNRLKYPEDLIKFINTKQSVAANDDYINNITNPSYITFHNGYAIYTGKVQEQFGTILGLYETNFVKNNWENGKIISQLSNDRFAFQPTLSPDGNKLVYCISKINNPNDTDLKMAMRNSQNEWVEVDDMTELNSNLSEITPYFASEDTLYFASNGFNGKGGYDIFYSVNENGIWEKPRPLTELNTEFNESDFVKISDNLSIFSSDRNGTLGGLDLWAVLINNVKMEMNEEPYLTIGTNTSEITAQIIDEYIFLIHNPVITLNFPNLNPTQNPELLELYSKRIEYKPSKIEVYISTNSISGFSLKISNLDSLIFSDDYFSNDTTLTFSLNELLTKENLTNIINIEAEVDSNNKHKTVKARKTIDIFHSNANRTKIIEYNNNKYKIAILPLTENFENSQLDNLIKLLDADLKSNKKKLIIESSPTFELTDNQRIRDYFSKLSNYKITYIKNIFRDLNKFLPYPNFDYLVIYIEI